MSSTIPKLLWRTEDGCRWFLVPDSAKPELGTLRVIPLLGEPTMVDSGWLAPFEISRKQALAWAKCELESALENVSQQVHARLSNRRAQIAALRDAPIGEDTTVTPDAPLALLNLIKRLPSVAIDSLAAEPSRHAAAQAEMAGLEDRLKTAGIDVAGHLTGFVDRLVALRKESEAGQKQTPER